MWWVAAALAQSGGGGAVAIGGIGRGAPPPPPPPVVPYGDRVDAFGQPLPEAASVRIGDRRWSAGRAARAVALSSDGRRLATAGEDGVAVFDAASGRLLARLSRERSLAVAFLPDGRAVWTEMHGGGLHVEGAGELRTCWRPEPWSVATTADGRIAYACDDSLRVHDPRTREEVPVPLAGVQEVAIAPDGRTAVGWRLLDPGGWRISLQGGRPRVEELPGVVSAAFAPDGRLALAYADRVEVDGERVPLPKDAVPYEVAWSLDGAGLAVLAQGRVLLHRDRKVRCDLPITGHDLVWGERVFVGGAEAIAPTRVDPATCAVEAPALAGPPVATAIGAELVVSTDGRTLAAWDRETGALRSRAEVPDGGAADLGLLPDGTLAVVRADAAELGSVHALPDLRVVRSTPREVAFRALAPLSLDGGYSPPDDPVAALAPTGAVAAGLGTLSVALPHGDRRVYDLTDQVHLDLEDPSRDWIGLAALDAYGGPAREVSPSWDPENVRPDTLALTALAWSGDGRRLAHAWEYQVTDAWGDTQVDRWIGILAPADDALGGFLADGEVTALALSADGSVLAWLADRGVEVARFPLPEPPAPPPPPAPVAPAPRRDPVANTSRDAIGEALAQMDMSALLGDSDLGGLEGGLLGGPSRVHRGLAQRLVPGDRFAPGRLQGRATALALSRDGRLVAVASDREVAVWRVGEATPRFRYDLDQGRTVGLRFEGNVLWATGADGTVLALEVE